MYRRSPLKVWLHTGGTTTKKWKGQEKEIVETRTSIVNSNCRCSYFDFLHLFGSTR
ncbi:unnamed protein product [Musa acuminata subsp. malaccensis]|uniref:(wild Malaysian banana) hypothetical protein n=1 Tax=Musa acuminata subsp. malaccensis TaxID=214687 RepID=A0A804IPX7_MUSAM|nr:unnamed protein product [Musa acuminata subsp. malaccensis]